MLICIVILYCIFVPFCSPCHTLNRRQNKAFFVHKWNAEKHTFFESEKRALKKVPEKWKSKVCNLLPNSKILRILPIPISNPYVVTKFSVSPPLKIVYFCFPVLYYLGGDFVGNVMRLSLSPFHIYALCVHIHTYIDMFYYFLTIRLTLLGTQIFALLAWFTGQFLIIWVVVSGL